MMALRNGIDTAHPRTFAPAVTHYGLRLHETRRFRKACQRARVPVVRAGEGRVGAAEVQCVGGGCRLRAKVLGTKMKDLSLEPVTAG